MADTQMTFKESHESKHPPKITEPRTNTSNFALNLTPVALLLTSNTVAQLNSRSGAFYLKCLAIKSTPSHISPNPINAPPTSYYIFERFVKPGVLLQDRRNICVLIRLKPQGAKDLYEETFPTSPVELDHDLQMLVRGRDVYVSFCRGAVENIFRDSIDSGYVSHKVGGPEFDLPSVCA